MTAESIRTAGARQALRVSDLYDVRNRMVSSLIGLPPPGIADPGHPFVLLAIDLAPADAAGLDATRCLGIATEEGGPTSHTAIIARSLGIPAVVAAHGLTAVPDGTLVLLDGGTGELVIEPSVEQQAFSTGRTRRRLRSRSASIGRPSRGSRDAASSSAHSMPAATRYSRSLGRPWKPTRLSGCVDSALRGPIRSCFMIN